MDIFLVNNEDPCAQPLSQKLSDVRPNQIIPLSRDEMNLFNSDKFQHITFGNDTDKTIVKVEPGASYIFVCNQNVNIDDVITASARLGIESAIIRTKK